LSKHCLNANLNTVDNTKRPNNMQKGFLYALSVALQNFYPHKFTDSNRDHSSDSGHGLIRTIELLTKILKKKN